MAMMRVLYVRPGVDALPNASGMGMRKAVHLWRLFSFPFPAGSTLLLLFWF